VKYIPGIMVGLMINAFAQEIDWSNFNASLVIEVTRPQGKFTCSGVAIDKDVVLTAAHCLEGEIIDIKVFNQSAYDPKAESWTVKSFELHPGYNKEKSNYRSDIARLKLNSKLPESTIFYPIAKSAKQVKGRFLRVGFGARSGLNARTLITPVMKSLKSQEETLELNDMYSYSGDSGGPIYVQENGQMYLVAIHSTLSYGPEGKFSLNPLLSHEREWINSNWN
jgi:V8-like Glu-specific endopeptidase